MSFGNWHDSDEDALLLPLSKGETLPPVMLVTVGVAVVEEQLGLHVRKTLIQQAKQRGPGGGPRTCAALTHSWKIVGQILSSNNV